MQENVIHVRKWHQSQPPTEEEITRIMRDEGLAPSRWVQPSGAVFPEQEKEHAVVIFVVSGSITYGFPIEGAPTELEAGDRLDLPAGVAHNAVVGPDGIVCLEARKIQEEK